MDIKTLGIDIAKNIFQLHGVDEQGNVVLKKRMSRNKLSAYIAKLPPCLIGMESCGGSNFWGRKFQAMGHDTRLKTALSSENKNTNGRARIKS